MTPLAAFLEKSKGQLKGDRRIIDPLNAMRLFDDVHCFEASDIIRRVSDFPSMTARDLVEMRHYLPAPRTWLEWHSANPVRNTRIGVLLLEECEAISGYFFIKASDNEWALSCPFVLSFPSEEHGFTPPNYASFSPTARQSDIALSESGYKIVSFLLSLINVPQIIGRKTHQPNVGLQRAIAKRKGLTGKFPLRAWTELNLVVGAPPEIFDGSPELGRLSGTKCLHFVRKFKRIRNGQVELVKAHWRGDGSLGIKRTRYILKSAV